MTTTIVKAADAAQFLSFVPRMLGYHPTRSLVVIPFHGSRTLGAMRIDLPDPATMAANELFAREYLPRWLAAGSPAPALAPPEASTVVIRTSMPPSGSHRQRAPPAAGFPAHKASMFRIPVRRSTRMPTGCSGALPTAPAAADVSGPAGVEGMAWLVEIDRDRRVIGGHGLALARFAVDLRPHHPSAERLGHQQVVDAHAEVLVEVAGTVIPPGVATQLGMMKAIGVHQPPGAQPPERLPLRRRGRSKKRLHLRRHRRRQQLLPSPLSRPPRRPP